MEPMTINRSDGSVVGSGRGEGGGGGAVQSKYPWPRALMDYVSQKTLACDNSCSTLPSRVAGSEEGQLFSQAKRTRFHTKSHSQTNLRYPSPFRWIRVTKTLGTRLMRVLECQPFFWKIEKRKCTTIFSIFPISEVSHPVLIQCFQE